MKLLSIEMSGLTCFEKPIEISFKDIGDGTIAIVGVNGSGKTTAMEAAPASLFKRFPTRVGSIYEHCNASTAFIESTWQDAGRLIVCRLDIDADKRLTEGRIWVDGQAASDGKAASFAKAIDGMFGSSDLFKASVFATQDKTGSFLSMARSERKSLFAQLLMLGALEAVAARAKGIADRLALMLERNHTELRSLKTRLEAKPNVEKAIATLAGNVLVSEDNVRAAEFLSDEANKKYITAQTEAASTTQLEDDLKIAERLSGEAQDRADAGALVPKQLQKTATGARTVIAAAAVDGLEGIADRKRDFEATKCDRRRLAAQCELDGLKGVDGLEVEYASNARAIEDLRARGRDRDTASTALVRAKSVAFIARTATGRAETQAELLSQVPCTTSAVWIGLEREGEIADGMDANDLAAVCPLLKSAREAEASIAELEDVQLSAQQNELAAAGTLKTIVDGLGGNADAEALAGRNEEISRRLTLEERRPALVQLLEELNAERREINRLHSNEVEAAQSAVSAANLKLGDITLRLAGALAGAEKTIELQREAAQASQAAAHEAKVRLASARTEDLPAALGVYEDAVLARDTARDEAGIERSNLGSTRNRLVELEAIELESDDLYKWIDAVGRQIAQWNLITEATGQQGAQAIEIDAAGPEIAAIANELLELYPHKKFTIEFVTLKEKASKPGEFKEVFDVIVYDGPKRRLFENLSGGERVIVAEAISLSLAIRNARTNRIKYETLWRDETTGALDETNAEAYVEMLRKARELGEFDQVIFVSHLAIAYDSADARIMLHDGVLMTN